MGSSIGASHAGRATTMGRDVVSGSRIGGGASPGAAAGERPPIPARPAAGDPSQRLPHGTTGLAGMSASQRAAMSGGAAAPRSPLPVRDSAQAGSLGSTGTGVQASGSSTSSWFRSAPSFSQLRGALSAGSSAISSAVRHFAAPEPPPPPRSLQECFDEWSRRPGVSKAQAANVAWAIGSGKTFGSVMAQSSARLDVPSLPDVFHRITDLWEVHLHDNFGPELPPGITASQTLEKLDVSRSRLQKLPDDLGSMPALTAIDVRGCSDLSCLPRSVDPSRISVIADPGSAIEEDAFDRLYQRTASQSARSELSPRIRDIASRMNALRQMHSSGQIGPQAWSLACSRVIEESMKGSDTLSGKGFAAQAELSRAQQSYRAASGLAGDLAAAEGPLTVGDLLAINSEVGRGATYHPNIREHGDSYGAYRTGRLPISDQQGDDLLHPEPSRLPVLMQELVDRVNLDSMRLQHSGDTFAKVELAASAASQLLSLHPFPDGNGRTAYQLMSLILQRYGLPPASMAPDAQMILHPGRGAQNPSQDDLARSVVSGMERSLDAMEAALASGRASPPR